MSRINRGLIFGILGLFFLVSCKKENAFILEGVWSSDDPQITYQLNFIDDENIEATIQDLMGGKTVKGTYEISGDVINIAVGDGDVIAPITAKITQGKLVVPWEIYSKGETTDSELSLSKNNIKAEEPIVWGESNNGLILGIQAKKSEWTTKETAEFTVYLKNEGKTPVAIPLFFFGLSTLKLEIFNEKGEQVFFMKENLSIELGEPITLSPKQILSTSQQVILSKETWDGSIGKFKVLAIYDTTNFKKSNIWSGKCQTKGMVFTVK